MDDHGDATINGVRAGQRDKTKKLNWEGDTGQALSLHIFRQKRKRASQPEWMLKNYKIRVDGYMPT